MVIIGKLAKEHAIERVRGKHWNVINNIKQISGEYNNHR